MNRKATKLINKITYTIYINTPENERKNRSLKNFRKNFKYEWVRKPGFKNFLKSQVVQSEIETMSN